MFRKTLTIFSLIGLLLSVAMWTGSHFKSRHYMYDIFATHFRFGNLTVIDPRARSSAKSGLFDYRHGWYWIGLHNLSDAWRSDSEVGWKLRIPLWIPTLFFATTTFWVLAPTYRLHKRKKLGLCLKCGYDLRASKDRCPECGAPFDLGTT